MSHFSTNLVSPRFHSQPHTSGSTERESVSLHFTTEFRVDEKEGNWSDSRCAWRSDCIEQRKRRNEFATFLSASLNMFPLIEGLSKVRRRKRARVEMEVSSFSAHARTSINCETGISKDRELNSFALQRCIPSAEARRGKHGRVQESWVKRKN